MPHPDATTLAQDAFKHIRAREFDAARSVVERSLTLYPDNPILAHAKAHLTIDSGAYQEGAEYLRAFLGTHDPFDGVSVHTSWHLAYIEAALGNPAAALDWHRRVVAPTLIPMTFYSAVTLIWQLEVRGHGGPAIQPDWQHLRTAALDVKPGPFNDLASAMTFIATGDAANLSRVRERAADPAADSPGAALVRPLIDGLEAFWQHDYPRTITLIEPLVPSLPTLSEFADQLSVYHDTLAAARAGLAVTS